MKEAPTKEQQCNPPCPAHLCAELSKVGMCQHKEARSSKERLSPKKLAEFRELVKFGSHLGVGGRALALLLDEIEACWAERKPDETAAGEPTLSTMYVSRICTAYESGYGRGESKRDLAQPYASGTPEALAYFEGYTRAIARQVSAVEPSALLCEACNQPAHRHPSVSCEVFKPLNGSEQLSNK